MFAVERLRMSLIETATGSGIRIVKPETNVERICWSQPHVGIKTKDVIQQNCLDAYVAVVTVLDLNIGLVPRQPKGAVEHMGDRRILRPVGQQRAALHVEQVKRQ